MSDPVNEHTTGWLVEEVFVESLKRDCRAQSIDHYHSDAPNKWPLVSVKAVLAEESDTLIRVGGNSVEAYNVYIVAEWPITDKRAEGQPAVVVSVSSREIDFLMADVHRGIRAAGSTQTIEQFLHFEIEPMGEGEKDLEEDDHETPTRRVNITSFQCIVVRG